MSYTLRTPNTTRFTILARSTSATLAKNSTFFFETSATVGGTATDFAQPAGSLIIGELRSQTVAGDPAAEWYITNGPFIVKALDQEPWAISTVAGSAYACTIANGGTNNIYITSGGVVSVDEILMTDTHAISYS
jgi:hypothetical protein